MPEQPDLPRPAPIPNAPPQKQPGVYPGQGAPEIPNRPGPDQEMPFRRGRPGHDIPDYPERPSREFPVQPGRVDQPEVPGIPQPQHQEPPPVVGLAD